LNPSFIDIVFFDPRMEEKEAAVKKKLFFLIFFISFQPIALSWAKGDYAASPTNYEVVESPTAYTLMHGGYDFVARMYENGGLFLRGNVGFHDMFMAGFSGNATNVIGSGTIQIQTPRLFLKAKVLDQKDSPVALSVAWDDRGYGTETNGRFFPGLQKGFYAVASHEFSELGFMQLHGGFNVVKFDNFDAAQDFGLFTGISFAFSPSLVFNLETDKISTDFWQINANFVFNFDNPLRVGVDFRDINRGDLFSRIVRVQYVSFF